MWGQKVAYFHNRCPPTNSVPSRISVHNECRPPKFNTQWIWALLRNQCVVLFLHVRSVNALCVRDALAVVLCLLTSSPFALVVGDERKFLEDIILRPVVKSQRMLTFEFLGTSKRIQRILFALRRKIWATRVVFLTYSLTFIFIFILILAWILITWEH